MLNPYLGGMDLASGLKPVSAERAAEIAAREEEDQRETIVMGDSPAPAQALPPPPQPKPSQSQRVAARRRREPPQLAAPSQEIPVHPTRPAGDVAGPEIVLARVKREPPKRSARRRLPKDALVLNVPDGPIPVAGPRPEDYFMPPVGTPLHIGGVPVPEAATNAQAQPAPVLNSTKVRLLAGAFDVYWFSVTECPFIDIITARLDTGKFTDPRDTAASPPEGVVMPQPVWATQGLASDHPMFDMLNNGGTQVFGLAYDAVVAEFCSNFSSGKKSWFGRKFVDVVNACCGKSRFPVYNHKMDVKDVLPATSGAIRLDEEGDAKSHVVAAAEAAAEPKPDLKRKAVASGVRVMPLTLVPFLRFAVPEDHRNQFDNHMRVLESTLMHAAENATFRGVLTPLYVQFSANNGAALTHFMQERHDAALALGVARSGSNGGGRPKPATQRARVSHIDKQRRAQAQAIRELQQHVAKAQSDAQRKDETIQMLRSEVGRYSTALNDAVRRLDEHDELLQRYARKRSAAGSTSGFEAQKKR